MISVVPGPKPTHIFEVTISTDSVAEERFRGYKKQFSSTFGYHGSKLESFHSILNYGLQQHLCKVRIGLAFCLLVSVLNVFFVYCRQTALYGEGIYLSSEMHVSLMFSPTGGGWVNSRCGRRSSCLAICEFVNHPNHLRCHTKGLSSSRPINSKANIFTFFVLLLNVEKSSHVDVPDKYFVITNNEIVRVRYLVVYGIDMRNSNCSNMAQYNENAIIMWIIRHKWLAAALTYAAILAILGASNNRQCHYVRQFMRQATIKAINYVKTFNFIGIDLIQKFFD